MNRLKLQVIVGVIALCATALHGSSAGQKPELVVEAGHSLGLRSFAFSPDGKLIVSGGVDGALDLWDVSSGQQIRAMAGHRSEVTSVTFSPDGRTVASGGTDNTVRLWDVRTGSEIRSFVGHKGDVLAVAFSPDGRLIASGSNDCTIKLWNAANGAEVRTFAEEFQGEVSTLAFSGDGRTLISAGGDILKMRIWLWDVTTGRNLGRLEGHKYRVSHVAVTPDGKYLLSTSQDLVRLWDLNTKRVVKDLEGSHVALLSKDGRLLAIDGQIWDVRTLKVIRPLTITGELPQFAPDGKTIAYAEFDQRSLNEPIRLVDVASGKVVRSFESHVQRIRAMAFSRDGKRLALASIGGIRIWDLEVGRQTTIIPMPDDEPDVYALAFSPDGMILAAGSDYDEDFADISPFNPLRLWDVETGRELRKLTGHKGTVRSLAFSPDGKMLASGSDDHTVKFWEIPDGRLIATLKGRTEVYGGLAVEYTLEVTAIAFSPDGRTLAAGNRDRDIQLWDVDARKPIRLLEGHTDRVTAVAFSVDGRTLVSDGFDQVTRFWDVATGHELRALSDDRPGTEKEAFSAAPTLARYNGYGGFNEPVSPDGKLQVKDVKGGEARLYDFVTGSLIASLISLDRDSWVVIDRDGRFDTNKPLDDVRGLHWLLPQEPLMPRPLDLFVREFYEPDLLSRLVRCTRAASCPRDFKPVPSIGGIRTTRPRLRGLGVIPH